MAKEQAAPEADVIAGWVIRGLGGVINMLERFATESAAHWTPQNIDDLETEMKRLLVIVKDCPSTC